MKILLSFFLLLSTVIVYGQSDFSGKWKLNLDKSQFNNTPGTPASARLMVEQSRDSITFQRNEYPKEALKIDSTASIEITGATSKTNVSMKPTRDKKGLIETRIYSYPESEKGEVVAQKIRTWSLSSDKKTLTIRDHIETTMGKVFDMVLIYERQ